MRKPNTRVEQAIERNPQILARFWSHVDRSDPSTDCWEWTGRRNAGNPSFQVCNSSIAPARIAWLWSTGELPNGGRLHHSCHNALCVRPSHLVWIVGRVMKHRLEAESEGYLGLSGAPLAIDVRPHYWPPIVRVADPTLENERAPELPRVQLREVASA